MILRGARVFVDAARFECVDVEMENGYIIRMAPQLAGEGIDLTGLTLLPGLIDLHTHGRMGRNYGDGESAVRALVRTLPATGVTAVCPALTGRGAEGIRASLAGVDAVRRAPEPGGACVLGAHLEGPFLATTNLGAIAPDSVQPISMSFYREMVGDYENAVRIITLSPELEGAPALTQALTARGIVVSAGHTSCSYEQLLALTADGLSHVTHLFNAMTGLHHRAPGVPAASLTSDVTVELICDGVHLHEGVLRLVARAKDPKQICLVTDSTEGTGMPDGIYTLGSTVFEVQNGVARMKESGNLAGSTLNMDAAVRHMLRVSGAGEADVVNMATLVPARELKQHCRGRIALGCRADFVAMTADYLPMRTIIGGQTVFERT